jgi:hypothetical protein
LLTVAADFAAARTTPARRIVLASEFLNLVLGFSSLSNRFATDDVEFFSAKRVRISSEIIPF